MEKVFTIVLKESDVNVVLRTLGQGPFVTVVDVLQNIQQQCQQQMVPPVPAEAVKPA